MVDRVLAIRADLRAEPRKPAAPKARNSAPLRRPSAAAKVAQAGENRDELLTELSGLQAELAQLQGDAPLIFPTVDAQAIAAMVSDWTGIPTGRMVKNEIETILKLADVSASASSVKGTPSR